MSSGVCLAFFFLSFTISASSATKSDDFSYSGSTGPGSWGGLCSTRKDQSPIDIVKKQTVQNNTLGPLTQTYRVGNATLVNDGRSITVVPSSGDLGTLLIDGKTYSLKQFHWHTPSEHRIDGIQYPAEIHLLHRSTDESTAVVSLLYNYGNPDPLISQISNPLKQMAKEVCGEDEESQFPLGAVDTNLLRRKTRKYFRYIGSKTTPPCNGTVNWTILYKVRGISKEQVEALRAPLRSDCKNNSRPVQPLNGRRVQFYSEQD